MKIKLLKTQKDYNEAVQYIEEIDSRPDFEDNEDLINEFELLADLIEKYENEHFPIDTTNDPIELITIAMDYRGLKRKDLYHIASKGVLSQVFNKKRRLSKKMIREFSELLLLDQEALNVDYELDKAIKKVTNKIKKEKHTDFLNFKPELLDRINYFQNNIYSSGMPLNVYAN